MRFSCGVIVGIILTLLIIGGAVGYHYYRKEPAKARQKLDVAEKQWNNIKNPVDAGFEKAKSALPPPEKSGDTAVEENNRKDAQQ